MNRSREVQVRGNLRFGTLAASIIVLLVLGLCGICRSADDAGVPEVPVKGKVTMVDIGAKECIPCKMMAPIMEELEKEYHATGRAAIYFIDVWKNKDQGRKFGIRSIPTQIFYDKDGKEVMRHEGFMDKKAIVAMLEKLGVK
jgi:thioredoxin 1